MQPNEGGAGSVSAESALCPEAAVESSQKGDELRAEVLRGGGSTSATWRKNQVLLSRLWGPLSLPSRAEITGGLPLFPAIPMDPEFLNSGPHACMADAHPAEPSPSPHCPFETGSKDPRLAKPVPPSSPLPLKGWDYRCVKPHLAHFRFLLVLHAGLGQLFLAMNSISSDWMYHSLFTPSLHRSHVRAIVEKVSTNTREPISVWAEVFNFFGEIPRSVITEPCAKQIFRFSRKFSLGHCALPAAVHEGSSPARGVSGLWSPATLTSVKLSDCCGRLHVSRGDTQQLGTP